MERSRLWLRIRQKWTLLPLTIQQKKGGDTNNHLVVGVLSDQQGED